VVPLLEEMGVLSAADRAIVACYCVAWSEFVAASQALEEMGRTASTGQGGVKTSPYVAMQRSAWAELRLLGAQLGLTPEGRARLHIDGPFAPPDAEAKDKRRFFPQ
jgi:P27 family predicted phage terminase small subunit